MSLDDVNHLAVCVADWIENIFQSDLLEDNKLYEEFYSIFEEVLEPFITKDRNYN